MSFNPLNTKIKQKKCRYCKEKFTPFNSLQPFCFKDECIKEHNQKIKEKKNKIAKQEIRSQDKSLQLKLAQTIVNKYVRLRDQNKPCISCGHIGNRQIHAGHYRPMGNNQQLRFYTLNIFAQCSICNNYLSGNLANYRINLINKLGVEKVNLIESNQERGNYSIEYLERLIKVFRKKIKLYELKFRG